MALFGAGVLPKSPTRRYLVTCPAPRLWALSGRWYCSAMGFVSVALSPSIRRSQHALTWLCSRNDIVANLSVLLAAAGVRVFDSRWPDILVGAAIAALFLRSAFTVVRVCGEAAEIAFASCSSCLVVTTAGRKRRFATGRDGGAAGKLFRGGCVSVIPSVLKVRV